MKIVKKKTVEPLPATPAQPTKPAQPAPKPEGPITTNTVKIKYDGTKPTPPRRGPQAGHAMTDIDVLAAYATPEELGRWRKELENRRSRNLETWIWQRSDRCGLVIKTRPDEPEGGACPKCNLQRRRDAGHLWNMSEKDTNDYLFEQARREKAELELTRQRAYRAANAERAQRGLEPLTFEEYRKQAEAEYRLMIERQRELGAITRQARERQQAAENSK